jgi:hypothetical protein
MIFFKASVTTRYRKKVGNPGIVTLRQCLNNAWAGEPSDDKKGLLNKHQFFYNTVV